MDLPSVESFDFTGKRVMLRGDLDVTIEGDNIVEDTRLVALLPTINKIFEKGASQIILIGHKGRPGGKESPPDSLVSLADYFSKKLATIVPFVPYHYMSRIYDSSLKSDEIKLILLENIRYWPEEEENREEFARGLASTVNVYVNDAFAASHREHASIVGIPKFVPHTAGLHFREEMTHLNKVLSEPKRPVVFLVSGAKEDKLQYLDALKALSDKVLVAGLLPTLLPEDYSDPKVILAKLVQDKEDITVNSIEAFSKEIAGAGTIVVSGPLGKYEDPGHAQGTRQVFEAISKSSAFRVCGGGDTLSAVHALGFSDAFDWISTGGGAMLEFLTKKTLPGIEALKG